MVSRNYSPVIISSKHSADFSDSLQKLLHAFFCGEGTETEADGCGDLTSYSYTGVADTLTLKITEGGNTYLSKLNIVYAN